MTRKLLLLHDGRYFLVTKRANQDQYLIQHPTSGTFGRFVLKECRRGPMFQSKPENIATVYDREWGAWVQHTHSEWWASVVEAELPRGPWYRGAVYMGAFAEFRGWPMDAVDDSRLVLEVTSDATSEAMEMSRALSAGRLPADIMAHMPKSPETAWQQLWPTLEANGWKVYNEDRFQKYAVGSLAIASLQLIEVERPTTE